MPFSMSTFMQHVTKANSHFNRFKTSSLMPLITALGGPYSGAGPDNRNLTNAQIAALLSAYGALPQPKRLKYAAALTWLKGALKIEWLVAEVKTDWKAGKLSKQMTFIHCSATTPAQVKAAGGLSPDYSKEWSLPHNNDQWDWHRFVFAFEYDPSLAPAKAAKRLGFDAHGYLYIFTAETGRDYMCPKGVITHGSEVGFPQVILKKDITPHNSDGTLAHW